MARRAEGSWRSHQVPMGEMHEKPGHIKILEQWMKSYRPEELFDANGPLKPNCRTRSEGRTPDEREPARKWRAASARSAHAGFSRSMPSRSKPGAELDAEATRAMGKFLRDVMKLNCRARIFACSVRMKTIPTAGRTCSK